MKITLFIIPFLAVHAATTPITAEFFITKIVGDLQGTLPAIGEIQDGTFTGDGSTQASSFLRLFGTISNSGNNRQK